MKNSAKPTSSYFTKVCHPLFHNPHPAIFAFLRHKRYNQGALSDQTDTTSIHADDPPNQGPDRSESHSPFPVVFGITAAFSLLQKAAYRNAWIFLPYCFTSLKCFFIFTFSRALYWQGVPPVCGAALGPTRKGGTRTEGLSRRKNYTKYISAGRDTSRFPFFQCRDTSRFPFFLVPGQPRRYVSSDFGQIFPVFLSTT